MTKIQFGQKHFGKTSPNVGHLRVTVVWRAIVKFWSQLLLSNFIFYSSLAGGLKLFLRRAPGENLGSVEVEHRPNSSAGQMVG